MPIADMYAGMHGVSAICAALFGRVGSGLGQHIDIALYDCMISKHDFAAESYLMSGGAELPVQTGHDLPQSTVYGSFSAQGGHLVIAAQMTDTWKSLARLIGGEAYAADTTLHSQDGRNANRESILAKVSEWTMARSALACCAALAPLLGQHNREIAASVGYSASDIDALEQGGVLYSEK